MKRCLRKIKGKIKRNEKLSEIEYKILCFALYFEYRLRPLLNGDRFRGRFKHKLPTSPSQKFFYLLNLISGWIKTYPAERKAYKKHKIERKEEKADKLTPFGFKETK